MGFLQDLETFAQGGFDRGDTSNPFARLSQTLGGTLFRNAGVFSDQQQQALLSGGRFDPALAASQRGRAFGQASSSLSSGLSGLAAQEAEFLEQQRRFNLDQETQRYGLGLQGEMIRAEQEAAKPNWLDTVVGIGGLLPGIGSIFQGIGALKGIGGAGGAGGGGKAFLGLGTRGLGHDSSLLSPRRGW